MQSLKNKRGVTDGIHGPVCVPLNPAWSAYFFIRNNIFLSQIPPALLQTTQIPP